jgi:OFA family oxalate/formate antiporter-like MFS transporter
VSGACAGALGDRGDVRRHRVYFGWYIVAAAFATYFVMGATLQGYVTGVFLVPMSDDLDWSRTEFITAFTLAQFVMAATGALVGGVIDRHGGRRLMFGGIVLTVFGLLLTAQVTELWQWFAVRGVMQGIGIGMAGPLVVSVTLSKWFVRRRGRAIGIAAAGFSLGGLFAPNVITPIVDAFGWRAGWRFLAVVTALVMVPAALAVRRQPEDYGYQPDGDMEAEETHGARAMSASVRSRSEGLTRGQALRTSSFWAIVLAFGLGGMGLLVLASQAIPYLTDSGFDRTTAAALVSLLPLPGLLTRAGWGLLSEKVRPQLLAAYAFGGAAGAMLVIVLGGRLSSVWVTGLGFLLFGAASSAFGTLQEVTWATLFGRAHLGAVRSAGMPFMVVLSAVGLMGSSAYFDLVGNYEGAFVLLVLLSLVAAGLISRVGGASGTLPDPRADETAG